MRDGIIIKRKATLRHVLHLLLSHLFQSRKMSTRCIKTISIAERVSYTDNVRSKMIFSQSCIQGLREIKVISESCNGHATTNTVLRSKKGKSKQNNGAADLFLLGNNTIFWNTLLPLIRKCSSFAPEDITIACHVLGKYDRYNVIANSLKSALHQVSVHRVMQH